MQKSLMFMSWAYLCKLEKNPLIYLTTLYQSLDLFLNLGSRFHQIQIIFPSDEVDFVGLLLELGFRDSYFPNMAFDFFKFALRFAEEIKSICEG